MTPLLVVLLAVPAMAVGFRGLPMHGLIMFAGMIGLMDAATRFEEAQGFQFGDGLLPAIAILHQRR